MTSIVRAVPEDLELLVMLEATCEGSDAWSESLIAEGISGKLPTTTWFVSRDEFGVVAYAVVSVVDDVAELQRIGTDPVARRRGLAAGVLERVRTHAADSGATRLLLEVREDNDAAINLYAKAGFAELDRRQKYYRDGATAIVMEVAL
jgi:[ribosomal protein S18]-alanine N-acetyltransferase